MVALTRLALASLALFTTAHLAAYTLQWGADGLGGTGNWDTTSANWSNGTQPVLWTNGSATFGGTAGNVTLTRPLSANPVVDSLLFNVAGYTLTSGWINGGSSGLTITTQGNATIGSTLSSGNSTPSGETLTKEGNATLTLTGTNFFDHVVVSQGELRSSGNNSLFFSKVTLADTGGAIVTLGQTSSEASIAGLNGGGPHGGIVRPDDTARTVTITLWGDSTGHSFAGKLTDNGSGILALKIYAGSQPQTLTGASTYTGLTTVDSGTLVFSGNGSALGSSEISIVNQGVLRLDNTTTANSDRLDDHAVVTLNNGTLEFIGNSSTAVTEATGTLSYGPAARISVQRPGSADATLQFFNVSRLNRGTLNVSGNGALILDGVTNGAGGIIGGHMLFGNDWATVSSGNAIQAFTAYNTNLTTATLTDNVLTSGDASVNGSRHWNSLKLQNDSGEAALLSAITYTLTLESGALLSTGNARQSIYAGTLKTGGSDELVVTNRNELHIRAIIADGVGPTNLVKAGEGLLQLISNNTYSGDTYINEGVVAISSNSNLGTGTRVEINGGTLRALSSFTTDKSVGSATGFTGKIDTNGCNVVFQSSTFGSLSKTGEGTLTLLGGSTGSIGVSQGRLILAENTYQRVNLLSGILEASGSIDTLNLIGGDTAILDVGGQSAETLTIERISSSGFTGNALQVRFDLGAFQQDTLLVTDLRSALLFSPTGLNLVFDFHDLGGLETGASYDLITAGSPITGYESRLHAYLTEELTEAGWLAEFHVTATKLSVTFNAIPEPAAIASLWGLAVLSCAAFRRRRS